MIAILLICPGKSSLFSTQKQKLSQLTVVLVSKGILKEYQFVVVLPDKTCEVVMSGNFFTRPKPSKSCKSCCK